MKQYSRHLIFCTGGDCKGKKLAKKSKDLLGKDSVHVKHSKVDCLGACKHGPVVLVYPDGVWYRCKDKKALARIIDEHIKGGEIVQDYVIQIMPQPK